MSENSGVGLHKLHCINVFQKWLKDFFETPSILGELLSFILLNHQYLLDFDNISFTLDPIKFKILLNLLKHILL